MVKKLEEERKRTEERHVEATSWKWNKKRSKMV